jgi:CMP-N,N'-diacetyllegionaminic acid synthase
LKVLAVIPARGGSKGVKDKNIRNVDGKPLIAYSIECAHGSESITKTIVNTDSEKIAAVASQYGATVMMRPEELASDEAPMVPVINHVLDTLKEQGETFDLIVLLQVTSPLRTGKNIDEVLTMFKNDPSLDGVISVIAMDDVHPARMYKLDDDLKMAPLYPELETVRRQDIPPVYYRNGCIYAVRTTAFVSQKTLMPENKKAYIMPSDWLANIDSERDLVIAEALIKLWKQQQ